MRGFTKKFSRGGNEMLHVHNELEYFPYDTLPEVQ